MNLTCVEFEHVCLAPQCSRDRPHSSQPCDYTSLAIHDSDTVGGREAASRCVHNPLFPPPPPLAVLVGECVGMAPVSCVWCGWGRCCFCFSPCTLFFSRCHSNTHSSLSLACAQTHGQTSKDGDRVRAEARDGTPYPEGDQGGAGEAH